MIWGPSVLVCVFKIWVWAHCYGIWLTRSSQGLKAGPSIFPDLCGKPDPTLSVTVESAGVELVLKHVFSLLHQSPVEVRAEQINTLGGNKEQEARVWVLGKVCWFWCGHSGEKETSFSPWAGDSCPIIFTILSLVLWSNLLSRLRQLVCPLYSPSKQSPNSLDFPGHQAMVVEGVSRK